MIEVNNQLEEANSTTDERLLIAYFIVYSDELLVAVSRKEDIVGQEALLLKDS